MATVYSGSDAGKSGLEMVELDGSPDVRGVTKINVSNTTLTDDGNGVVTLVTGGGGGGSGTVTSITVSDGTFVDLTATPDPITTTGSITADLSASGTADATTFLRGDNTWATPAGGSWSITDGTTTQTIAGGDTLTVNDGNGITAVVSATDTLTLGTDGVLQDLNTLGAAAADGEFIVATGPGVFAYESGATARTSLGISATIDDNGGPGFGLAGGTNIFTVSGLTLTGSEVFQVTLEGLSIAPGETIDGHYITNIQAGGIPGSDSFDVVVEATIPVPGAAAVKIHYLIIG